MDLNMIVLRRAMTRRGPGTPHGDAPRTHASVAALMDFVDQVARLRNDEETPGGMSGDDAVTELANLIDAARQMSPERPSPRASLGDTDPLQDAIDRRLTEFLVEERTDLILNEPGVAKPLELIDYPFATGPKLAPCRRCSGGGEITEYPPDDDERMVACPACGGTGEAYE